MTQEQRLSEIQRIRSMKAALQKQVSHYTELEQSLLREYALATCPYKEGIGVVASVRVRYDERMTLPCKLIRVETEIWTPIRDGKTHPEEARLRYIVAYGDKLSDRDNVLVVNPIEGATQ